ncbi:MAG TPA: acylphosphatase [Gemmatimonadales bacterium]|nr:acylphosphatase [Gemmatimonadales bacterium]
MDPSPPGARRIGRRFLVTGRVQGVGFRYFVLRRAQELELTGWTRNLENGDVEVRAWGEEPQLSRLAEKLAVGPRSARVTNVEMTEISEEEETGSGFRVVG